MKSLGIILARKGSKGIKNKNLLSINDKSLIEIAIESSLKSKKLTKLVFTSDSKEYLNIASQYKNLDLDLRPRSLASDNSKSLDVVKYIVKKYTERNINFDCLLILQPTTPFRKGHHIDKALSIFEKSEADSLMTVKNPYYPVEWFMKENQKGFLKNVISGGNKISRRQDTNNFLQPSGLIFIYQNKLLNKIKNSLPSNKTISYKIKNEESINIDSYEDYILACEINKKYGLL